MNRENIQKVRDVIAAADAASFSMAYIYDGEPEGFDPSRDPFGELLNVCGTTACIAGWTLAVCTPTEPPWRDEMPVTRAASLLGLRPEFEGRWLFAPDGYEDPRRYSRAHAIRVLDHLLATGVVDWKSTRRAKKADASERQGKVPGMDQSGASS